MEKYVTLQNDSQSLIEQALRQPGVADVMQAYQNARIYYSSFCEYSELSERTWNVTDATSAFAPLPGANNA